MEAKTKSGVFDQNYHFFDVAPYPGAMFDFGPHLQHPHWKRVLRGIIGRTKGGRTFMQFEVETASRLNK